MKTNSLVVAAALIGAGLASAAAQAEGPGLRLALNAAAPQNRLDASRYPAVAAALVAAAKEIGDQLG